MQIAHPLRVLILAGIGAASVAFSPAHAVPLAWIAGTGDWNQASNWSPAQVPTLPDSPEVNNGGTATIGAGSPTNIANLLIGAGSGNVSGKVDSVSDVSSGALIQVGTLSSGVGNTASGTMTATGANVAGSLRVGVQSLSDAASAADGQLQVTGGNLTISNTFGLEVGHSAFSEGSATGAVTVDGTLAFATAPSAFSPNVLVGVSSGGVATGTLSAGAVDTTTTAAGDVNVGVANTFSGPGGTAIGHLALGAGTLATTGNVAIGTALGNAGGIADGEAQLANVDLIASGAGTQRLDVGTVTAAGLSNILGQGSASGTASVRQVTGFDVVSVGSALGTSLNGLDAIGELTVGAGGLQGSAIGTSTLDVGVSGGLPNNNQIFGLDATATGRLESTGGLTGFAAVQVGVNGGGSASTGAGTANGNLTVSGGDVTIGDTLGIGVALVRKQYTINNNTGADITATGTADFTGGTLSVGSGRIAVGQATVIDSSTDPAMNAAVASGSLTLTDVNVQAAGADLNVGHALGGFGTLVTHSATGTLNATGGQIHADDVRVGVGSGPTARATGSLSLDGTSLTAQTLTVGSGSGSSGDVAVRHAGASIAGDLNVAAFNSVGAAAMRGALMLDQAVMTVGGNGFVGPVYQDGVGELTLMDSSLDIAGDLYLGRSSNAQTLFGDAKLWLERSTITVGNNIIFDIGASLSVMIFGTDRGAGYGAIDAGNVTLDGRLSVDLSNATLAAGDSFDLIISEGLGQITGDFLDVSIFGLGGGLIAQAGIVSDFINGQQVDIYRLSLAAQTVPEPGSLALLAMAMVLLATWRARMPARSRT